MDVFIKARENYISKIKEELLGPGSEISFPDKEHELISSSPLTRYSVGILYPKGKQTGMDSEEVIQNEDGEESNYDIEETKTEEEQYNDKQNKENFSGSFDDEENFDEEISLATQNLPSSMGITFFAAGEFEKVHCSISFATYRKTIPNERRIPFEISNPENFTIPDEIKKFVKYNSENKYLEVITGGLTRKTIKDLEKRLDDNLKDALYKLTNQEKGYIRVPHNLDVELTFPKGKDYIDDNKHLDNTDLKITALRHEFNSCCSITIMLVNDSDNWKEVDSCYFQPEIKISTENNNFLFCEYGGRKDFSLLDEEEQSLELQYRNKKNYANGLGVATDWNINDKGQGEIHTEFIPETEVPSMDFTLPENSSINEEKVLSMKYYSPLVSEDKDFKLSNLKLILEEYRKWIEALKNKQEFLDDKYKNIANKNIDLCNSALQRMEHGIKILSQNDNAWTAFSLSNEAMFIQRAQLKIQSSTSDKDRFPNDEHLSNLLKNIDYSTIDTNPAYNPNGSERFLWRPFQIAFILMSILSIVDEKSSDRNLVDLIWFPTGGGKTEAYLGLTAFSIFYRRLTYSDTANGTNVIMRYTLRLLAAQQFTRASTLICACEYIRKNNNFNLGVTPITIGLWIGGEHTPNTNKDAKKHLDYLNKANPNSLKYLKDEHNKFQVLKCPWCGTKLVRENIDGKLFGEWGYFMKDGSHFKLCCPQDSCFFSGTEENFAEELPVQVVDEELYQDPPTLLFGTVDKFAMMPWNEKTRAFFGLNTKNRPPELIIQDELHLISGPLGTMVGLFESALDIICEEKSVQPKIIASTATIRRAKEQCGALYNRNVAQFPPPGLDSDDSFFARESRNIHGRKYIGLMPSGKTKAMMEIRSISALLQTAKDMDLEDFVKDKFWTLTVYFNSLKDLGKCSNLVEDDVKDFIKRMVFRTRTTKDARMITSADELTSRIGTTELNETLDKLEKVEYTSNPEQKRFASNIVLATNMISVGIDVPRLNIMLVVGQPKLTSEYIQASSRVGRRWPGTVFTLYDSSKSRDRSHYEQFKSYHESFYKYVEPTGATPFSRPARERALHAVVITLLRLLEPELSDEKSAIHFKRGKYENRIQFIKDRLLKRNKEVMNKIYKSIKDDSMETATQIDNYLSIWESRANEYISSNGHFFYGGGKLMFSKPEQNEGRLMKAFKTAPDDEAFDTMTSMRNVDSSVKGHVLIWKED